MHLQGVLDEIICKAFSITIKGAIPNTFSTFKELSGHFVTHFIGGQRYQRSSTRLLNIKQRDDESLRSYLTWINKKALLIDEVDDKVLVTTFTNGLQSKEFLFSIYKNDPEDDGWHVVPSHKVDECWRQHDSTKGQIEEKGKAWWPSFGQSDKKDDKRSRPPLGRIANFTPLNASLDQVLIKIKDDPTPIWLDKLKGDPNKRPRNKYCHFHWDHGHDTFECYDLKWQIEALIK